MKKKFTKEISKLRRENRQLKYELSKLSDLNIEFEEEEQSEKVSSFYEESSDEESIRKGNSKTSLQELLLNE